jgi:hypothetical protein
MEVVSRSPSVANACGMRIALRLAEADVCTVADPQSFRGVGPPDIVTCSRVISAPKIGLPCRSW